MKSNCFKKELEKLAGACIFYAAVLLFVFTAAVCRAAHPGERMVYVSDSAKLFVYKNDAGKEKQVKNIADLQKKRLQVLDDMQKAMGPLPDRSNLPPLSIQIIDSLRENNYTRYNIRVTVADNEDVTAYLYAPVQKGKPRRLPAMLVLHGTSPLGKMVVDGSSPNPNRAHAKELAQRGYVVIAPDYPSFGDQKDYDFENDRYQSGTMKAIFNHMRCVDLLQARKDVDPDRIGVLGHSLGGHNAMFAGAFDTRLKVIVASCGWTLLDYYDVGAEASKKFGGKLGPWAQTRYMPLIRDKYHLDPKQVPFDFDEIITALAPRAFFSNSPLSDANFDVNGVKRGIAHVQPVYRLANAAGNLQVRYPQATHDFPPAVRLEAYEFIDKVLKHTPNNHQLQR